MKALAERLPELAEEIEDLKKLQPDFKSICEEYDKIARALVRMASDSESPEQARKEIEYNKELLDELEEEIRLMLQEQRSVQRDRDRFYSIKTVLS